MLVWGVYRKLISWPVIGFKRGGRNVAFECGIWNIRCSIYFPIRDRAPKREGRVREVEVKVIRVLRKISLVINVHISLDTRRSEHWEEVSRRVKMLVRISSDRQRQLNSVLMVAMICICCWER